MRISSYLLSGFALVWMTASVAMATGPVPAYTENGFNPGMLDTSVPKAERLKLFAEMMSLANQGQVRAQDLAGTVYWRGSRLDGNPVDQDLEQARKLLANAAIHGDVLVMAKLAELELEVGRAPQAMVWAQMYARYTDPMNSPRARSGRSTAYASNLIERVGDAGGKIDESAKNDVAVMVARFDKSIRRGIDAFNSERRSAATRLLQYPRGVDKLEYRNINGVAEYIVAFDSSGNPGKIWLLDTFPDPEMDSIVRHYLDHVIANSAATGTGPRYLKVSIVHRALKSRRLRPTH